MDPKEASLLVVDNGLGNVNSVLYALARIGKRPELKQEAPPVHELDRYGLVVLPGVGSYDQGVTSLRERGWTEWLQASSAYQTPILGLCLGMQLLCEGSSEGEQEGLGLIPGRFERFTFSSQGERALKVPHMGWNYVQFDPARAPWSGDGSEIKRFYFVHSYHLPREDSNFAVGWTNYGGLFPSAIARGRTIGLQFHPEKSHRFGANLLKGIVDWARA